MFKRIVIIGISGTGKSFAGIEMARRLNLPLHHMDSIIWSKNWVETPHNVVQDKMNAIVAQDSWIIEGWIDSYSKTALDRADKVIYLDYAGWRAAWGGLQRSWAYTGKKRPEMPEGCVTRLDLGFVFRMLLRRERPHIEGALKDIAAQKVVRLSSRAQLAAYLAPFV